MVFTEDQLTEALRAANVPAERIAPVAKAVACAPWALLTELHLLLAEDELSENDYQRIVSKLLPIRSHSAIEAGEVDRRFVELVPIGFARDQCIIGMAAVDGCMPIVTNDLRNSAVVDHVGSLTRTPTRPELAPREVIEGAINRAYAAVESDFSSVLDTAGGTDAVLAELDGMETCDLLDSGSRAPVIKLVNMVLFDAVKRDASDVHVQPFDTHVQIRYRIDGVLYDHLRIPRELLDEVVSRIKIIGKMDIAEKRLAQDGRTSVTIGDKTVDLRLSIIPTSCGERVVLRLLDKSARLLELPHLGMSAHEEERFKRLLERPHGIILVTGPTGSGKSTTLYAALQHVDCREKNVLTLEDPIEYRLSGVSQTQISNKKGMTFATGLRAVLRQDPDVIMVGEIRDEETARMAVQSSLTGHLVLSTLHTNDAAGAVTRLLDLGIEPYLVASSLLGVLAQRLVRILCPDCRVTAPLSHGDVEAIQLDSGLLGREVGLPNGCERCSSTGYRGREGIFELLVVDEVIRDAIVGHAKSSVIKARAIQEGMTTLMQNGIATLLDGSTSIEELARVAACDEPMAASPAAADELDSVVVS